MSTRMTPSTHVPSILINTSITSSSSTAYNTFFINSITGTGTVCNPVVTGGGPSPFYIGPPVDPIDVLMERIMYMTKEQCDKFMFKVICERLGYDPAHDHDGAYEYATKRLIENKFKLPEGNYILPDEATLKITKNHYEFSDKDAKVTYKSNWHREFNEYVNVSDVLEKFVQYASSMNLSREQFLAIPIQTFLMWLVIEAARKDGDPVKDGDVKQLELALGSG